jgi:hypothetical protein
MAAIFSHQIVESKEEEFQLHIKAIKTKGRIITPHGTIT